MTTEDAPPPEPAASTEPAAAPDPAVSTEPAASPEPEPAPAVVEEPDDPRQPASYVFFAIIAIVGAALDLVSKEWATEQLAMADPIKGGQREIIVIPNYFDLQYAQNPGGAWSMLRSLPEIWRRPFFLFVSTAASVFIMSLYGRIDRRDWPMKWGLPLALGGAVGNLVDRIRHGYVVDFLHVFVNYGGRPRHWPTFNVADVWIVAGVILMAMSLFFGRGRMHHLGAEDDEDAPPGPSPESKRASDS